MKTAKYIISLHNKGGAYKHIPFTGTRVEARAKAKEVRGDNGSKIHFVRYVDVAA